MRHPYLKVLLGPAEEDVLLELLQLVERLLVGRNGFRFVHAAPYSHPASVLHAWPPACRMQHISENRAGDNTEPIFKRETRARSASSCISLAHQRRNIALGRVFSRAPSHGARGGYFTVHRGPPVLRIVTVSQQCYGVRKYPPHTSLLSIAIAVFGRQQHSGNKTGVIVPKSALGRCYGISEQTSYYSEGARTWYLIVAIRSRFQVESAYLPRRRLLFIDETPAAHELCVVCEHMWHGPVVL